MIQHSVMWKFKENQTIDDVKAIKNKLEILPTIIPQIAYYAIGLNIKQADNAMDMILISKFESKEDMLTYAAHDEHQKIVKIISESIIESRVVDFEYSFIDIRNIVRNRVM